MEQVPTAEHLQLISNIAHWIEGGIFGVVAVIALLQALGYAKSGLVQHLWPGLILLAGVFLPAYLLLQRGFGEIGESWTFVIGDRQQREHLVMSLLLIFIGANEILSRAGLIRGNGWRFITPAALAFIGAVLMIHTEYGTPEAVAASVTEHRYQGGLVILVGLFKAADELWGKRYKWLAFMWILLLFGAAVLLISYREPDGAYRTRDERQTMPSVALR